MDGKLWQPHPTSGDVIIRHRAPKVWVPCAIARDGDLNGVASAPCTSRPSAIIAASTLLKPGGRIYIHHQDDALWEEVPPSDIAHSKL
jgi:hypothetical protein